jgi:NodT family efflux transporter outer membrane factor (OMF) lipoprotein
MLDSLFRIRMGGSLSTLAGCLVAAGLLSACAVGPDYHAPKAPEVTAFTRQADPAVAAGTADIRPDWWTAYGSPRLDGLVQRALQHNPGIDAGLANLRQAQEVVKAQRGLFFPQVQAGYSANRQNSGQVLASPLASNASLFTLNTAQLSVGFVPDVFGGNQRQVESLQAGADSQRLQLEALRVTLASNVATAVIQEQMLVEQIAVLEEALQLAQQQLAHTRGLKAQGYVSGLDLAQQESTYAQTAAQLPPLRKQLEQTRHLLAVLCGEFPAADLGTAQQAPVRAPAALPQALPSQLVSRRPDVQAAAAQYHAAYAQIGVATANMLPQLSLTADLAYSGGGLGGLLSAGNKAWSLLGGVSAPLFSGGTLSARKRAAEAGAEAAQAQYQSVVLSAFQNVADTLVALQHDGQALAVARDAEAAAQNLQRLTRQQFDQGYVAQPQWLGTRQTWLQARLAYLAAQAVYLGDTVALHQALGGGWHPDVVVGSR